MNLYIVGQIYETCVNCTVKLYSSMSLRLIIIIIIIIIIIYIIYDNNIYIYIYISDIISTLFYTLFIGSTESVYKCHTQVDDDNVRLDILDTAGQVRLISVCILNTCKVDQVVAEYFKMSILSEIGGSIFR